MNTTPERTIRLRVERVQTKSKPKAFLETPLGKALLAFALTTILGTWLTTCYQMEEWTRQQDYTARMERSKKRAEVAKGALEQISAAYSLNNDLVYLTVFGGESGSEIADVRDTQLKNVLADWFVKRREWRVSEKVLTAEMEASFRYPATHCLLADVLRNREDLERDVEEVITKAHGRAISALDEKLQAPLIAAVGPATKRVYVSVRATTGPGGLLSRLSDQMIQETIDDRPTATPLWRLRGADDVGGLNLRGSTAIESAISQYLKALCTGNADAVPLTSDVRITEQPTPALLGRATPQRRQPPLRGVDAARRYIGEVALRIKSIREVRRIVHGNYARVLFDITLDDDAVLPSCECFRFEDGKIADIKPYFDPRSAAQTSPASGHP